ncbi:MAG: glycosyltransferase [Deltaproteobacteria bacterium]|nr:glycosyltransferase [Deltaproteobacteria bacterium]
MINRKLVSIVPTQMKHISEREMEPAVRSRDLSGYFSTVYTIHPFATEDRVVRLDDRNIVYEFSVKPLHLPAWLNWLDYLISQVRLIGSLYGLIKRENISAIKAHDPYMIGLDGLILSVLTRRPMVVFVLSNYDLGHKATGQLGFAPFRYRWVEKIIERVVFKSADMVWGGNGNNKQYAISNGASPEKCRTVRTIGICDHHFQAHALNPGLRHEMGLKDEKVLLYVGRLSPEKYPQDVIRCAAFLSSLGEEFRLLIAGDGVMAGELNQLVGRHGIADKVMFLGFRPQAEVRELFSIADVVLSPLTGSSLVEAALAGKSIVAYDVEWHREIIRHEYSGLLVKYRDHEALARATLTLLQDTELAARLGRNVRDLAIEMFSTEQTQQAERKCFEELFQG